MSRGLACPWDEGLKGLDRLKGVEDQSGRVGLQRLVGSDMFGIPNSYP